VSTRADLTRVTPWVLCGVTIVLLAVGGWLRHSAPDQPGAQPWVWLEQILIWVAVAGIPPVGALIASRQPANPYGWLWCAIGLDLAVAGVAGPLADSVGAPAWVAVVLDGWTFAVLIPLLVLAVLLFPTGRLPGPRWRWLTRAVVAVGVLLMIGGPFVPAPDDPAAQGPWALQDAAGRFLQTTGEAAILLLFCCGLAALSALVVRYRRAAAVERQQLTWFMYAAFLAVLVLVFNALGLTVGRPLTGVLGAVVLGLFPVAVAVAVLRYRLYEIDRIVSRTVSYGLLSAALIGLYLLVVALLRPLLEPLTGSSALAVAGSTLAVAAVFNPARRRLQAVVDRRFDRARYDAARAVDAFAARLRDQVDLDEITAGLRDTVAATVAPGRISVWLRVPARQGGSGP
jgi:hypothetical protein